MIQLESLTAPATAVFGIDLTVLITAFVVVTLVAATVFLLLLAVGPHLSPRWDHSFRDKLLHTGAPEMPGKNTGGESTPEGADSSDHDRYGSESRQ